MRGKRGFSLVELLVVLAIIGILSTVVIYKLFDATDRGRQKRTMADLRAVAIALESYAIDHQSYPTGANQAVDTLDPILVPTYIRWLPRADAWKEPLRILLDAGGAQYTIFSGAGDRLATPLTWRQGPTTNYNDDIVISTGGFVQWPEGIQVR